MLLRPVVNAGIDYITLTAMQPSQAFVLSTKAHQLLRQEIAAGNMQRPWGMAGYEGWRAGPVQWGERVDGVITRLSGNAAATNWWELYQASDNVSRIDLQVTVRTDHDPTKEVMAEYRAVKKRWANRGDGPTITIWRSGAQGITVYLGKRSSRLMCRIYNKHAESGLDHWQGCVRYEVEFKSVAALSAIGSIVDHGIVHDNIVSRVHAIVRDRGGLCRWSVNNPSSAVVEAPKMATDRDRQLQWLRVQVRPTVQSLLDQGLDDDVYASLGLPNQAQAFAVNHRSTLASATHDRRI